ncbi:PDDEXK family nuclease [Pseudomonas soli]|uniref:hypothetical protein n=1 Tax=Pseudomonas soli TaxID=1306993 RepID=UPI00382F99ED
MLYQLTLPSLAQSYRVRIERPDTLGISEKHIEDFLSSHIVELIPEEQLMLLAQERKFQEEADILALDRKGTLFIFELKRWQSSVENLLQVMRYGQKFGRYTYAQLEELVQRQQRLQGSLRLRHQEYFGLECPLPEQDFNREQRFVVVTNGVDNDTLEAIQYWSKKGVHINSLTYKLYQVAGEPYIQFDTYNPELDLLVETNPGIFIVNTNSTYMADAWRDMLADGKKGMAAAYYDRKHAVQRIGKGSTVFLYHTGVGVIAKGKATGPVQVSDYQGDAGEQYAVPLQFEWALTSPADWPARAPKAYEINAAIASGHRFRPTVFNASETMRDAIQQIWVARKG